MFRRKSLAGIAVLLMLLSYPAPGAETVRVMRVLSGNRILLVDGRSVQYIGVGLPDQPLAGRSVAELQEMSRAFNRSLVERATVKLVLDKKIRSRRGDLLAYVYLGNRFINAEMIEQGYALVATEPPNERYTDYFKKLLRKATREQVGFWQPRAGRPLERPQIKSQAGKVVYTQPGDPYYYPKDHPQLGPQARPMLLEDAVRKGLKPVSLSDKESP